jgi:hypothetical protein
MVDVPQQDWIAYESLARASDVAWVRGLTSGDRFTLYADMFDIVCTGRPDSTGRERLDRRSWQQKLAARQKAVAAFTKLDEFHRERPAAHNAR